MRIRKPKLLTILVDMDDTIEDLLVEWLHILNKKYKCYVTLEDIHEWDLTKAYPKLTAEQVYSPLFTDDLWENVKPKWDAVRYLRELIDDGHEVYITTSSNLKTINKKVESIINRYFPYIPSDHIIVCSNKQMIRGDVMVDDGPHNLENGEYHRILFTAPHNRYYDAKANGMRRADNWREVYSLIRGISYGVS